MVHSRTTPRPPFCVNKKVDKKSRRDTTLAGKHAQQRTAKKDASIPHSSRLEIRAAFSWFSSLLGVVLWCVVFSCRSLKLLAWGLRRTESLTQMFSIGSKLMKSISMLANHFRGPIFVNHIKKIKTKIRLESLDSSWIRRNGSMVTDFNHVLYILDRLWGFCILLNLQSKVWASATAKSRTKYWFRN